MANISPLNKLKMCSEDDFFEIIEESVECRIPLQMRNILKLNCCTSAIALSRDYDILVDEIQNFMKYQFNDKMLKNTESLEDYVGMFVTDKTNFQLMTGQKRTLQVLHEYCRKLYPSMDETIKFESEILFQTPPQLAAPNVSCDYVPSLSENEGLFSSILY